MSGVERSPLGDERPHAVPCATCRRPTFNHSQLCESCKKKWSPTVRLLDALARVSEHESATPGSRPRGRGWLVLGPPAASPDRP